MQLPLSLITSLRNTKGFNEEAFEQVHTSGEQITSIRINPSKANNLITTGHTSIPWSQYGYYLEQRPSFTFDPLFHAGTYYVQEASSMFLEQALKQTVDLLQPIKVLDLCAAPGGKSTHIQSLISKGSLLVSNEVIRARVNILKDNIIKWGCENVFVSNNDPKDFSKLKNYFDVIVVDAPCSGSGLFRKDTGAIEEWSENNVQLCSQRQQRILADVLPALKEGGVLIYSTCSYSYDEDEAIADWLTTICSMTSLPLTLSADWGITTTDGGYRFWPDKVKGEGFFLACFKKNKSDYSTTNKVKNKPQQLSKKELPLVERWIDIAGFEFIQHENTVYAWPAIHFNDLALLLENLRVIYSGILVGEIMRDKIVPDHALAMSKLIVTAVSKIYVDRNTAIHYLQRKDIKLATDVKGWSLISFEQVSLGWANVLPNRVNNYYPKNLRILKEL